MVLQLQQCYLNFMMQLFLNQDEVSALHIAVQNGHVEVVEALTHKMDKDDLNARDNVSLYYTFNQSKISVTATIISYNHWVCDIFNFYILYIVLVRYDSTDVGH